MRRHPLLGAMVSAALLYITAPAFAQTHPGVRCVQEQLNVLGFDAGIADGLMGGKTRGAATEYLSGQTVADQLPDLSSATALEWCVALAETHAEVASFAQGLPDDELNRTGFSGGHWC